jgi:hypothetical protein
MTNDIYEYIKKIDESTEIKVFVLGYRSCISCQTWTREVLVPTCNKHELDVEIIYMDEVFIPFKPEMSPTTYFYIKNDKNPIMIVGEETISHIEGIIDTAKFRLGIE